MDKGKRLVIKGFPGMSKVSSATAPKGNTSKTIINLRISKNLPVLKVVICGKYKNLNKITKIKDIALKIHRLLIFVILYSLLCKIEGHAV